MITINKTEPYTQFFPDQFSNQKFTKTPLTKALQNGNSLEARKIIESRNASDLSEIEKWQIKVLNNLNFNDENFLQLNSETQNLIYRTANNLNNIQFVKRLNSLRQFTSPQQIRSPSILSQFMDIDTTSQIIFGFLVKLHQENRLLKKEELKDQNLDCTWITKCDFTRILGCNHLLKLINQLNLKYIKVPEKKLIIKDPNNSTLTFKVKQYTGNVHVLMEISSGDVAIYAQEIKPVERFLSRDEIFELFSIIEASNFMDMDSNIMISEDGIYFIDTEFKSFSVQSSIPWNKVSGLESYICPEDRKLFRQLISQKIYESVQEDMPDPYFIAQRMNKFYKERFKQQILKGETIDPDLQSLLTDRKSTVSQCKLVGSNKQRTFTFRIKDILAAQSSINPQLFTNEFSDESTYQK